MSTEPFEPSEVEINPAPAEGDGYYQSKLRQWVSLCPHMGPSERTVLDILTSLTTQVSNRRKLSLDELRQMVFTNPVTLGEEPTPISSSGLLRLLRKLAQLGQITADEDGTEIKFSSRKNAQHRPITMTIWRLPRHECGGSRNVFDALDEVRGEEPRFERSRSEQSGARRRAGGAGRKSDPEQGPGSESNPWGSESNPPSQQSNPGGSESNPDVQGDQREQEAPFSPPITPPDTPSSSSAEVEDITDAVVPEQTKKKTSKPQDREQAKTLIGEHFPDSADDEREAIIDLVYAEAAAKGVKIGFIATYIGGRPAALLEQDLVQVRRHSAAPTVTHCGIHQAEMKPYGCDACAAEIKAGDPEDIARLRAHLALVGEKARPDLARLLGAPVTPVDNVRSLDEGERIRRMQRRPSGVVGGSRMPVPDHNYWASLTPEQLKNIL